MTELAAMEHAGGVGTDARGSIALPEPQVAGMSAELTTEVVSDLEGIAALEPDYECLYRLTGNTLPFALQDWYLAWCRHFLSRRARNWPSDRPQTPGAS